MRVCVSRGFRACCSTRVPRASSHSIFFKKLITTKIITTFTNYNFINFTITITSTTSAILLLLLLRLLLLLLLLLALVLVLLLVILVLVLLLLLILLLLLLEVLLVRVGSARLRFARVPRVMRVCVSRGFRACCSARVPRASSHSIFFKS